jgi:hypothetical protein
MPEVVGRLRTPRLAAAPASPAKGEMYFDTGTNKLYWWNGTAWIDSTGGSGSIDLVYNGEFPAGTPYTDGDIVIDNGVPYLCVMPTSSEPTPWQTEAGVVGPPGPAGPTGPGVPAGGSIDQILTKMSATDYDASWSSGAYVTTATIAADPADIALPANRAYVVVMNTTGAGGVIRSVEGANVPIGARMTIRCGTTASLTIRHNYAGTQPTNYRKFLTLGGQDLILAANSGETATFYHDGTWWVEMMKDRAAGSIPVGGVVPFAGGSVPDASWLLADGTSYLRTAYPALFAALGGTSSPWGLPDGTHFNVPDLRRRVPVGAGSSVLALGGSDGAAETSRGISHKHSFSSGTNTAGAHTHANAGSHDHPSAGDHTHQTGTGDSFATTVGNTGQRGTSGTTFTLVSGSVFGVANAGAHQHGAAGDHGHGSAGDHSHTVSGNTSGGTPTDAPSYAVVNYLIRAA